MIPKCKGIRIDLNKIEEIDFEIQGRKDYYYDLALLPNADIKQIKRDMENDEKIKQLQKQLDLNFQKERLMPNCNLTTCRYNANGKCENKEKREECVDVSMKVLCLDEPFNKQKSFYDKMRNMSEEELFKARLQEPICKE